MKALALLVLALAVLTFGCSSQMTLHIEADTLYVAEISGHDTVRASSSRVIEIEDDACASVRVLGPGWCRVFVVERSPGLVPDHEWTIHVEGTQGDTLVVCATWEKRNR